MRKLRLSIGPVQTLLVAGLSLAPLAQAQAHDSPKSGMMMKGGKEEAPPPLERANAIQGGELYDVRGYLVGRVSEVVLGRELDHAALALVTLPKDTKTQVAVPITTLRRDKAQKLMTDVSSADLVRAPRIDMDDWSGLTNPALLEEVDAFFKEHSYRYKEAAEMSDPPSLGAREQLGIVTPTATPYQKLTKLVGLAINARTESMVGNLEDLIIDPADGKVTFAVLSFNPTGHSERFVIAPWTSIQVQPRLGTARVDTATGILDTLAFDPAHFPNLQDRTYTGGVFAAFGREPYWQVYGYAPRAEQSSAWRPGSAFNRNFDAARTKSVIGYVESVGTFIPEPGAADGVRLRVASDATGVVTVLLGPKSYCDRLGIKLHQKTPVTVSGSEAMVDGKPVIYAVDIQTGGKTYALREPSGVPLWTDMD